MRHAESRPNFSFREKAAFRNPPACSSLVAAPVVEQAAEIVPGGIPQPKPSALVMSPVLSHCLAASHSLSTLAARLPLLFHSHRLTLCICSLTVSLPPSDAVYMQEVWWYLTMLIMSIIALVTEQPLLLAVISLDYIRLPQGQQVVASLMVLCTSTLHIYHSAHSALCTSTLDM